MTAREGRWVGAWLALAAVSFVSLPWYFQADKSLVQALVDVWGGADSASGIVEAARHGRPWLWVVPIGLAVAFLGMRASARRRQGVLLAAGASIALAAVAIFALAALPGSGSARAGAVGSPIEALRAGR